MASFSLRKSAKQLILLSKSKDDDRVIYARKAGENSDFGQVLDGERIDLETASKLKELVWGSANMPLKLEWMKQGLTFHPPDQVFAYGLQCPLNGTKNFLMCFQAYILKQLLFDKKSKGANMRIQKGAATTTTNIRKASNSSSNASSGGKQAGKKNSQNMVVTMYVGLIIVVGMIVF